MARQLFGASNSRGLDLGSFLSLNFNNEAEVADEEEGLLSELSPRQRERLREQEIENEEAQRFIEQSRQIQQERQRQESIGRVERTS